MNEHKRPLIIFSGQNSSIKRVRPNYFKQNLLLKGLMLKPTLEGAMKYAGIKSAAEAYTILDRLAMRKEYHEALARYGVDFDFIVSGLKNLAQDAKVDGVKLNSFRLFLQSLGLATYEKEESGGKGWEELVARAITAEKEAATKQLPSTQYPVKVPEKPTFVRKNQQMEKDLAKNLYGHE